MTVAKPQIGVIVGSNSKTSINKQLAHGLVNLVQDQADFEFLDLSALPFYNRDDDADAYPAAFTAFKDKVRSKNGILFVTPEHNRSVPAYLKNALDGASRPYGSGAWNGIPAGIIGTSTGGPATAMAQQHLRNILVFLDMPAMAQPEGFIRWTDGLVGADGKVAEASEKFLRSYMERFLAWVALHPKK
nr:NADPH-dependent FMN reductase [Comamonas koreensis]